MTKTEKLDMEHRIQEQLAFLGLKHLSESWNEVMDIAAKKKPSYHKFLSGILQQEHDAKVERMRLARLKAANMDEMLVMDTFPFKKQPKLKMQMVMELYDSLRYMTENQVLCFIGPTGCGKTGLGRAYLIHAINRGYRGLFIGFPELVDKLYQANADFSGARVLKKYAAIDCLLIDELGYRILNKDESGPFFELMKMRHKKKCTIITTQLGFDEWNTFFRNKHLTSALLDRITEHCTLFNMREFTSIRNKNIVFATDK